MMRSMLLAACAMAAAVAAADNRPVLDCPAVGVSQNELPCGWMAPDADQMEASRSQPVGAGDLNREYYRTHASARC